MKKIVLSFVLCAMLIAPASSAVIMPSNVPEKRLATEVLWKAYEAMPKSERPRIIVVMGGGGARGLSHIGVLRAFQEEHIPVDEIVGVSVGALIGSLYAAGIPIEQIETMATEIGWNKLTDYSKASMVRLILSEELLSTDAMQTYLDKRMGGKTFADLNIPFSCIATDIRTGERVVFREGPVVIAARASATIPAVFKPVEYRQRSLVDGGLVDNLPVDVPDTHNGRDILIGVLPHADVLASDGSNVFKSLVRAIEIQRNIIIQSNKKTADFIIEPDVRDVGLADLNRSRDCIEAGVAAVRKSALDLKLVVLQRAGLLSKTQGER